MNRLIAVGVIALLVLTGVVVVGFSYFNEENNELKPEYSPSPTTTPTPSPTPTSPTPTAAPLALKPANLVLDCILEAGFYESRTIDGKNVPSIRVKGTITNIGEETAYNITLHVKAWFSNGIQSFTADLPLIWEVLVPPPYLRPSIEGNDTLVLPQNSLSCVLSVPDNVKGTDWTNAAAYSDCISSYEITATWE
jgi:hypothetical protein